MPDILGFIKLPLANREPLMLRAKSQNVRIATLGFMFRGSLYRSSSVSISSIALLDR